MFTNSYLICKNVGQNYVAYQWKKTKSELVTKFLTSRTFNRKRLSTFYKNLKVFPEFLSLYFFKENDNTFLVYTTILGKLHPKKWINPNPSKYTLWKERHKSNQHWTFTLVSNFISIKIGGICFITITEYWIGNFSKTSKESLHS